MDRNLKPFDVNYIDSQAKMLRLMNGLLAVNGQLLNSFLMPKESYPRDTYMIRIKIPEDKISEFLARTGLQLFKPLVIEYTPYEAY